MSDNSESKEFFYLAPNRYRVAVIDIVAAWNYYWLWTRLALHDIQMRYRGSMLGPLWLTISTAFMAFVMGILYARLFNADTAVYLPYVTTGLLAWNLISTLINEACNTFVDSQAIIQQTKLPYFTHVYRVVYRNLLILLHNVIIIPVLYIIYPPHLSMAVLGLIPALIVLSLNGMWIACSVGLLGARFRDLPPIISNFLQALFFVTPIFWQPELLGRWVDTIKLNPLFAAVDILRAPLLMQAPSPMSWPIMLGFTAFGCLGTYFLYARFRGRIPYWV